MTSKKLEGYEFYEKVLNGATKVIAPMVDQSELAWRMLSRKYDAELCYSPMFHSSVFASDASYRAEALHSCAEDRPLIIQFCGNNPETVVKAAKMAEDHCDAIDINLGCPQMIAKRGFYGAFLEDSWDLIRQIVEKCHKELKVPVTCKIRVFDDIEKSVKYAKMIEKAGCQLLTVHGRTKEMRGPNTGIASWKHIKAVKQALKIPVFANGNIQYKQDYERCMEETGVDGVMIAEGSLRNPCLFSGVDPVVWDVTLEYLDFVDKYPCPLSYVRGHVFKMCQHALQVHQDVRLKVANAKSTVEIRGAMGDLKRDCLKLQSGDADYKEEKLPLPYWICQPYIRPPKPPAPKVDEPKETCKENRGKEENVDQPVGSSRKLSKNQMKKLLKRKHAPDVSQLGESEKFKMLMEFKEKRKENRQTYVKCLSCKNPAGLKSEYCKNCRKVKNITEKLQNDKTGDEGQIKDTVVAELV